MRIKSIDDRERRQNHPPQLRTPSDQHPECEFDADYLDITDAVRENYNLEEWECSRPVWEEASGNRCVWHTSDGQIQEKPPAELEKAVGDGDLHGSAATGVDLSGIDFPVETGFIDANLSEADLEYANLSGADLGDANLSGADLRGADLSEADLGDANLSEADLEYADLSEADLEYANLSEADLEYANLSEAYLRYADLSEAYLRYADLSGADLRDANLSEADLRYADLSEAYLTGVDLSGADLRDANLSEADLRYADLSEADLHYADLSEADLRDANLSEADLRYADLSEADLRDANLSGADLTGANLSDATVEDAQLIDARFEYTIPHDEDVSPMDIVPESNLAGADLSEADLEDADLSEATLLNTDLSGANLRDADLSGANLRDADLSEADLEDADLSGADLVDADLSGADLVDAALSEADLRSADLSATQLAETEFQNSTLSRETDIDPPSKRIRQPDSGEEQSTDEDKFTYTLVAQLGSILPPIRRLVELVRNNHANGEETYDKIARANHELREAYSANGLISRAREARFRERKARRREAVAEEGIRGTVAYLGSVLSMIVTGYGVRLRWVAFSMLVLYLVSAGIYWQVGDLSMGKSLYYSVVTFTTSPPAEPDLTEPILRVVEGFETFAGTAAIVFLGYVLGTRERV